MFSHSRNPFSDRKYIGNFTNSYFDNWSTQIRTVKQAATEKIKVSYAAHIKLVHWIHAWDHC